MLWILTQSLRRHLLPQPQPQMYRTNVQEGWDGWCVVWWFCSQWTWGTYNTAYDRWGDYQPCSYRSREWLPHKRNQKMRKNEASHAKMIKSSNLAIIDQQRAFMKRNNLIVGNQIALCNKQKEVINYFKSFSQSPKPKDVYKTNNIKCNSKSLN